MKLILQSHYEIHEILFWLLDLAGSRYPDSTVYVREEYSGKYKLSKGLTPVMYSRICSFTEIENVWLECRNGNTIAYSIYDSENIGITGLPDFENFPWQAPAHSNENFAGATSVLSWSEKEEFADTAVSSKLRQFFRIAQQVKGRMLLSSEATAGKMVPIMSRGALDGYHEIMDVAIIAGSDWLLWNVRKGMVYSQGFRATQVQELLADIAS